MFIKESPSSMHMRFLFEVDIFCDLNKNNQYGCEEYLTNDKYFKNHLSHCYLK